VQAKSLTTRPIGAGHHRLPAQSGLKAAAIDELIQRLDHRDQTRYRAQGAATA